MKTIFFWLAIASIVSFFSCKKGDYTPPEGLSLSFKLGPGTTQKSYIKVGNATGALNASKIEYEVSSSANGQYEEIIFSSNGKGIKSLTYNGKTVPFQNGSAKFLGDFTIKKGISTSVFYVSYFPINTGKSKESNFPSSNDTNSVTLVSVREKNTLQDIVVGLKSPTMKMVSSGPDSISVVSGGEDLNVGPGGAYSGKITYATIHVYGNSMGGYGINKIPLKMFEANLKRKEIMVQDQNRVYLPINIVQKDGLEYIEFVGGYGAIGHTIFYIVSNGMDILIQSSADGTYAELGTYLVPENPLVWTDRNSTKEQSGTEFYWGPVINSGVLLRANFFIDQ